MNDTINLGRYSLGDTTPTRVYMVDRDGEPFDMNGSTAITLEAVSPQRDVLSIACAVVGEPEDGWVDIDPIGTAFTPTTERRIVHFEGEFVWQFAGDEKHSVDRVKFAIELFP